MSQEASNCNRTDGFQLQVPADPCGFPDALAIIKEFRIEPRGWSDADVLGVLQILLEQNGYTVKAKAAAHLALQLQRIL